MAKAVVWIAIGLYGVPLVVKYIQAWRDRDLN
jgi:hypothetical protein